MYLPHQPPWLGADAVFRGYRWAMPEKRGPGRPPKHPDEPVSLAPLSFEEALRGLMATGEHTDEEIEAAGQRAREDEKQSTEKS